MKRIINGKTYNTDTAEYLCEVPCETDYCTDFRWHETVLYRTPKGAFFLAGEGNAMSMWAESTGNGARSGEGIRPISADEALEIMEEAGATDEIEEIFGACPEAGDDSLLLSLPTGLRERLTKVEEVQGMPTGAAILHALTGWLDARGA